MGQSSETSVEDLIFVFKDYRSIGFTTQYFVFPSQEAIKAFETSIVSQILSDPKHVCLDNCGALFKIRAAYTPVWPKPFPYYPEIRCGVTNQRVWRGDVKLEDRKSAFEAGIKELKSGFGNLYHISENY